MNYDRNTIDTLLDRYWEGECTLEEERQLKAYFSGPVAPDHRKYAPLFQAIASEQAVQMRNAECGMRNESGVQNDNTQMPDETNHSALRNPPRPSLGRRESPHSAFFKYAALAAAFALLFIGYQYFNKEKQQITPGLATTPDTLKTEQSATVPTVEPSANTGALIALAKATESKKTFKFGFKKRHKNRSQELDPETRKALEEVKTALALVSRKMNKGASKATKDLNQMEHLDKLFKHRAEG
ncbi:MAG: hypothetical protein J0L99_17915 [Chitinophagales bacterium]|nr:hypothetical protein [Chitinophagales bacterium]